MSGQISVSVIFCVSLVLMRQHAPLNFGANVFLSLFCSFTLDVVNERRRLEDMGAVAELSYAAATQDELGNEY